MSHRRKGYRWVGQEKNWRSWTRRVATGMRNHQKTVVR
jgi:hypothetical protein